MKPGHNRNRSDGTNQTNIARSPETHARLVEQRQQRLNQTFNTIPARRSTLNKFRAAFRADFSVTTAESVRASFDGPLSPVPELDTP